MIWPTFKTSFQTRSSQKVYMQDKKLLASHAFAVPDITHETLLRVDWNTEPCREWIFQWLVYERHHSGVDGVADGQGRASKGHQPSI